MKPLCGRTIKEVIAWASFMAYGGFIASVLRSLRRLNDSCDKHESLCAKRPWMIVGISVGGFLFLCIAFVLIRRRLVGRFWMYWILCLKQLKCDFRTRKDRSGVLKRNGTLHFTDDQIMWIDHRKEIRISLQWSIHIINPVDKTKWLS